MMIAEADRFKAASREKVQKANLIN